MKQLILTILLLLTIVTLLGCTDITVCGDGICNEDETCEIDCGYSQETPQDNNLETPVDEKPIIKQEVRTEPSFENPFSDLKPLFVASAQIPDFWYPKCDCDTSNELDYGEYFLGEEINHCYDNYISNETNFSMKYENTSNMYQNIGDIPISDILSQVEENLGAFSKKIKKKLSFSSFDNTRVTSANVLCVYNSNSTISQEICEYYLTKRVGASILGLDIPDTAFLTGSTRAPKEDMTKTNFDQYVKQEILNWVNTNTTINITHLAVAKDIPTTVESVSGSEYGGLSGSQYLAYNGTFSASNSEENPFYGKSEHFNPDNYPTIRFAVSYLTGYTIEDIKKMIDKAQEPIDNVDTLKWVYDRDYKYDKIGFPDDICILARRKYTVNEVEVSLQPIGMGSYQYPQNEPMCFDDYTFARREQIPDIGTMIRSDMSGQDYVLAADGPIVLEIKTGDIYSNNGQEFVFYGDYNKISRFNNPETSGVFMIQKAAINNPLGDFPPSIDENFVKVSGDGIDTFKTTYINATINETEYERIGTTGWPISDPGDRPTGSWMNIAHDKLILSGIIESNIILDRVNTKPLTISSGKVIAYSGSGKYHGGYGGECWVTQSGNFDFEVSNRAVINSYESYNARTFTGAPCPSHNATYGATHGMIADAISSNAFGGTNYSNSFAGATGHVNEPYLGGVNYTPYWMSAYASGLTLAESALSGWRQIQGNKGNKGITIGDPLMTILDPEKLSTGNICIVDSDCSSSNCDADKFEIKRCHPISTNCVTENTTDLSKVETTNEDWACIGLETRAQCDNGTWVNHETAPEKKECAGGLFNLSDGEECTTITDCATNYRNINSRIKGACSKDIGGINRCHQSQFYCILDESAIEIFPKNSHCIDSQTKKFCDIIDNTPTWSESKNCPNGCDNNNCVGEATQTLKYIPGKEPQWYVINIIPVEETYEELFQEIPMNQTIYLWRDGSWTYLQNRFLNGLSTNTQIIPGEGIRFSNSGETPFQKILHGSIITEPVEVMIGNSGSFVGFPLADSSTASEMITEINEQINGCEKIFKYNVETEETEYYSLDPEFTSDRLEVDFEILSDESYWISCSNNTKIAFTPKYTPPLICNNNGTCDTDEGEDVASCPTDCADCRNNLECGTDSFVGERFCDANKIMQTKRTFTCNSPMTENSECSFSDTNLELRECWNTQICVRGNCLKKSRVIISNNNLQDLNIIIDNDSNINKDFYGQKTILIDKNGLKTLSFDHNFSSQDLDLNNLDINTGTIDDQEYIFVNDLNQTGTKSIFIEKTSDQTVCFLDEEVSDLNYLKNNCTSMFCPGTIGNIGCEIENDFFKISGLTHSGVITNYSYCGDSYCNADENCSTCTNDCGSCEIVEVLCTLDSECGTSGFNGDNFCEQNKVKRNNLTYECKNPGESNSYCLTQDTNQLIEDCGTKTCIDSECVEIVECTQNNDCNSDSTCQNNSCELLNCTNGFTINDQSCICGGTTCNDYCYLENGICCDNNWSVGKEDCNTATPLEENEDEDVLFTQLMIIVGFIAIIGFILIVVIVIIGASHHSKTKEEIMQELKNEFKETPPQKKTIQPTQTNKIQKYK